MGSAAGGAGGAAAPPDFGENMDFFDFCNDKSDFLSIPPPQPPQILESSGPHEYIASQFPLSCNKINTLFFNNIYSVRLIINAHHKLLQRTLVFIFRIKILQYFFS